MSVKLISEKVSYQSTPQALSFVILGKIERWKESLLVAWCVAWVFCGGIVISEYLASTVRESRMMYVIFLIFWAYFLWRVGRVTLFRRGGNELIRIEGGELTLKRSIFTFGKSKSYYLENIEGLRIIELDKKSIAYTYENTWWVMGGERIGFDYQGRFVKFGMQLSPKETKQVFELLRRRLNSDLKKSS